jgi:hypothetical protein
MNAFELVAQTLTQLFVRGSRPELSRWRCAPVEELEAARLGVPTVLHAAMPMIRAMRWRGSDWPRRIRDYPRL